MTGGHGTPAQSGAVNAKFLTRHSDPSFRPNSIAHVHMNSRFCRYSPCLARISDWTIFDLCSGCSTTLTVVTVMPTRTVKLLTSGRAVRTRGSVAVASLKPDAEINRNLIKLHILTLSLTGGHYDASSPECYRGSPRP